MRNRNGNFHLAELKSQFTFFWGRNAQMLASISGAASLLKNFLGTPDACLPHISTEVGGSFSISLKILNYLELFSSAENDNNCQFCSRL